MSIPHGTAMFHLWSAVKQQPETFGNLVDQGHHSNLIARALSEGVLIQAKKTLPCVGCGRPSRLLHAAKNPVLITFNSIKQANADKLRKLGTVYVKATGTGFNVTPYEVKRALVVTSESTVDEIVTWAARQQR